MFLRYARTLDTLFLFPQQSLQLTLALVVAYGLLALGLFTPFVLVLLIILEGFTPLFIAVKINALLPIVLLFLGAGRSYSLDRVFFSQHRWRNVSQFSLELFPRIRHYIILPYALLSFIAFLGHVGDPLWRNGAMSRHQAYKYLAQELGVPQDKAHIGMFDIAQCKRVVQIAAKEQT